MVSLSHTNDQGLWPAGFVHGRVLFQLNRFPHPVAKESARRGARCFPQSWWGTWQVAGWLWVTSPEVHAGHAGCGGTPCRHALPDGVAVLGIF